MRTTIDIPDELLRQAKARAALEGVRLRDFIEKGLRLALATPSMPAAPQQRVEFPLHHSRQPGVLSVEAVHRAEERAQLDEDAAHASTL
jgi:hypothetical protein